MKESVGAEIKTIDKKIHDNMWVTNTTGGNPVDTCLKYSPVVLLFILQQQGFRTKNNFRGRCVQVAIGAGVVNIIIRSLKNLVKKTRPNGQENSFPSSHTATCMLGAELLRAELKESYPGLSYSGYVLSVITALLRMYHNKHWLSDVASGAVLGFISFKLTEKIFNKIDGHMRQG